MPNVSTACSQRLRSASRLQPGSRIALQRHQRQVLAQAEAHVQALALAVLAQVGEALVGRFARAAESHSAAAQFDAFDAGARRSPSRPSNSSVRPAPTSPAKPRISPGRTSKLTSCGPARAR